MMHIGEVSSSCQLRTHWLNVEGRTSGALVHHHPAHRAQGSASLALMDSHEDADVEVSLEDRIIDM